MTQPKSSDTSAHRAAWQRAIDKALADKSRLELRPYQREVFECRKSGVIVLHWSRQIGKSFVLAAFAVDRAIRHPGRLITVLSNSLDNGAEFLEKCREVCGLMQEALDKLKTEVEIRDLSPDVSLNSMRLEIRFKINENGVPKTSRIKVLAANPRTARGFSGDLILDEFAFHENSAAIWEAAEPILASNPDFLCRIASTGNGRHNLFYRMATAAVGTLAPIFPLAPIGGPRSAERWSDIGKLSGGGLGETLGWGEGARCANPEPAKPSHEAPPLPSPLLHPMEERETEAREAATVSETGAPAIAPAKRKPGRPRGSKNRIDSIRSRSRSRQPTLALSQSGFALSRVTRSQAYARGVKIYDAATRREITPEQARAQALDKRAYDQNYECAFADENLTLLSHDLISAAECEGIGEISEQEWTASQLARLQEAEGQLFVGFDVARRVDLSVITVMEKLGELRLVRAMLRLRDMRLPDQQSRLGQVCRLPKFARAVIDMTGLGLGLYEYAQNEFGSGRIHGINFATSVPATRAVTSEGRKQPTVRVTEALALELLQCYEDRRIKHPADARLRDDLRKPEKTTTPGGRVSIAATRDEAGHADHFWSLALAVEAAATASAPFAYETFRRVPKRVLV